MPLFETIVLATDFSETSVRAQDYVRRLRQAGCKKVVALFVLDTIETGVVISEPAGIIYDEGRYEGDLNARIIRHAREKMQELTAMLEEVGLEVEPIIISGVPAKEIVKIADARNASLIVVGSHGRSNLANALLGSVSDKVIRTAKQPVLVVRREE